MVRALCMTLVLALTCGTLHAEAPRKDRNAALKYWQALGALPDGGEAQKTIESIDHPLPLDAKAREVVKKYEFSLQMLRNGTNASTCDWENDYEAGIEHMLPQVQACRTLARLSLLDARILFEDGENSKAIDAVFDTLTLARRITPEGSFVSSLVGYAIEFKAIDVLSANLPKLDNAEVQAVAKRYDALPPVASLSSVMNKAEVRALDWLIEKVEEKKNDKEGVEGLVKFLTLLTDSNETAQDFLKKCGGDAEGVIRTTKAAKPVYEKFAAILDLPLEKSKAEADREFKAAKENPVIFVFLPAIIKVRDARARIDVRIEMFRAALAVQLDGESGLKNHPDPVVGGSFKMEPFAGGFELQSNYTQEKVNYTQEKVGPLKLVVGQRKK